jgi:hypothetical protein
MAGNFELNNFLVGALIFSVVFVAFLAFEKEIADEYEVTIDESYRTTYDRVDNLTSNFNETYKEIQDMTADQDAQFFTGIWSVIKIGNAAIKSTGTSVGIVFSFVTNLGNDLRSFIPDWVPMVIIAIITISLGLLVIRWVLRR